MTLGTWNKWEMAFPGKRMGKAWTDLERYGDKWRDIANTGMKLRVP
jgi:hypothetical protein